VAFHAGAYTASLGEARISDNNFYGNDKTTIITGDSLKYICAIQNSVVAWSYMSKIASSKQGGFYEIKPMYISQLPVPDIQSSSQKPFESLVDVMVYGLYFEAEMRAAGCYINERVAEVVQPFTDTDADEFKAAYVKKLAEFCGRDPDIYAGLIHSRNVRSIEVVLGALKR